MFSTLKRLLAVLIAVMIVLAAGVIVGQAPELFGSEVTEDPEASVEFDDQTGDGTAVTVDHVSLSHGGFVVVADGTGTIVGVSEYLPAGDHEDVTIEQREDDELELFGQLTATVHQDTTGDEEFAFEETDGEEDRPYVEDGYPVSDTATVTLEERPDEEAPSTSFIVESVDAPESVTTEESLEVVAEVRNPNEVEMRQHVELRVGGEVLERQVLSLEAEETRELTLEVDGSALEPGDQTFGIYTTDDGDIGEIEVIYEGPATLEVLEADTSSVTVDATLPADGFVAVENETGDVVGTSDPLEPGEHEAVTVGFDESVDDGEELTVVLYEGDPAELDEAEAFEEDGERVEATITAVENEDNDNGEDEDDDNDDGDD